MAIWKKESAEEREARKQNEEEQAASLTALEEGRIPLQAERRLREQADRAGFFSSDLTTNEHLLVRQAGFEPVGQVMGSSFYRVAYSGYYTGFYQSTGELTPLSQAQLDARTRAVSRLKQEAALLGADGVVGIRLTMNTPDWADRLVEFTAIGTAIRSTAAASSGHDEPFTSILSGQEFWKLHQAGFLPKEVAFGVCSFYIHSDLQARAALNNFWGAGMANQELGHYTAGFQEARNIAMSRFAHEVKRAGAQGAVGVQVDWDAEEIEYEVNETSYVDLLVHFAAVGTAIVSRGEPISSDAPILAFYNLKDRASFKLNKKE